jgi:hypothetical protein
VGCAAFGAWRRLKFVNVSDCAGAAPAWPGQPGAMTARADGEQGVGRSEHLAGQARIQPSLGEGGAAWRAQRTICCGICGQALAHPPRQQSARRWPSARCRSG